MRVMRFPLKILTIAGCRVSDSWSLCKRAVYNAYTIFICLLLLTFMLPQLMDLIMNVDNTDDFTDTFYVMLATIMACCKMFGLLLNRKNIEMLINMLITDPLRPLETDEETIQRKFDDTVQTHAMWYTFMVEITCALMNLMSMFTNIRSRTLTYREWTPYDLSSDALFYFTYFHQLASLTAASVVNVACDCMICGLLVHICCQFEILECRLQKYLFNRGDFGECVRQHERIYKFAYMVNDKFRSIIAVQFAVSTLVVCSNMYQLAKATLSVKYIPLLLYTSCMLLQILIYCWYGNEVKLKSVQFADRIFGMDWVSVDKRTKEKLIMIMNRSLVPIELSSAHILTMNLDSFGKLLKVSYSVYNILRTT